jgi:hypothetical protein
MNFSSWHASRTALATRRAALLPKIKQLIDALANGFERWPDDPVTGRKIVEIEKSDTQLKLTSVVGRTVEINIAGGADLATVSPPVTTAHRTQVGRIVNFGPGQNSNELVWYTASSSVDLADFFDAITDHLLA